MKESSTKKSGLVSVRLLTGVALVSLVPILIFAAGPPFWWGNDGVINGNQANDYAPVNQGQLKLMATAAFDEFTASLPNGVGNMTSGSTGYTLTALINHWSTLQTDGSHLPSPGTNPNDYAPVNIGQAKSVAKPFTTA